MKQIDFVDQAKDEQPVTAKTKAKVTTQAPGPAAATLADASAADPLSSLSGNEALAVPRRSTATRRKAKRAPAKPPRKNRPAGSRDDMQRLNMEVPRQLHKRLKLKAIYEDRTVTDIVLQAINDYLNSH